MIGVGDEITWATYIASLVKLIRRAVRHIEAYLRRERRPMRPASMGLVARDLIVLKDIEGGCYSIASIQLIDLLHSTKFALCKLSLFSRGQG